MPEFKQSEQIIKQRNEILKAIDDYLEIWKAKATKDYLRLKSEYIKLSKVIYDLKYIPKEISHKSSYMYRVSSFNKARLEQESENIGIALEYLVEDIKLYKARKDYLTKITSNSVCAKIIRLDDEDTLLFLSKVLDKEKENKKEHFVTTIENLGGEMLRLIEIDLGMDGTLNGKISCVYSDVAIQTIGAGGYNIQIFHYRLLCKALQNRINPNIDLDLREYREKPKVTKEKKEELDLNELILAQANKVENKLNKEGKNRGQDIWEKLNQYGYNKLIDEKGYTKLLDTPNYPILIRDIDSERKLIWGMSFAFIYTPDKPYVSLKKKLVLWWNVESTDSMTRVSEVSERAGLDEFKEFVKVMVKRGKIPQYGEPEKNIKDDVQISANLDNVITYNDVKNLDLSPLEERLYDMALSNIEYCEQDIKFAGVKRWNRIVEYNYDKKIYDLGWELLCNSEFFPIFVKRNKAEKYVLLLTPSMAYKIYEPREDGHIVMENLMYFYDGTHKVKDLPRIAGETGEEVFEMFAETMNFRKKLTPYTKEVVGNSKVSRAVPKLKANISPQALRTVLNRVDETFTPSKNKETFERLVKIATRFRESGFYYCENGDGKKLEVTMEASRVPLAIEYHKTPKNKEFYYIYTLQQLYLYKVETQELVEIADLFKQDENQTLEAVSERIKVFKNPRFEMFLTLNNLKKKLPNYVKPEK